MKKQKLITLSLMLAVTSLATGCSAIPTNSTENTTQTSTSYIETQVDVYNINDDSSVMDDLILFGLACNDGNDDLALSDLEAIFPGESNYYVYFQMPEDTDYNAYRVDSMCIDDKTYDLELLDIDGYYQKYIIDDFSENDSGEYLVTEVNFSDEKDNDAQQTYNLTQDVTFSFDESAYTFNQEYRYSITLAGQNFESIYQFNKKNNILVDLWSNVISDASLKDTDKRSFFYFAFNCYDEDRKIEFVPDDILSLTVDYDRLTYEYNGNSKEAANNIAPETKHIEETIEPDEVKVTARSDKKSNKRLYIYNTINKLSEADLSLNTDNANAAVLEQAAKKYSWAVAFGAKDGYPYKLNSSGFIKKSYDYAYTEVADFKAIHIVYRYEGKEISTNTNSLIKQETITETETFRDPTLEEETDYDLTVIWQNPDTNILQKITETISYFGKPIVIKAIIMIGIIFVLSIIFTIIKRKAKRRHFDEDR